MKSFGHQTIRILSDVLKHLNLSEEEILHLHLMGELQISEHAISMPTDSPLYSVRINLLRSEYPLICHCFRADANSIRLSHGDKFAQLHITGRAVTSEIITYIARTKILDLKELVDLLKKSITCP